MGSEAESLSWADTAFYRHAKAQETGGWYWSLSSGLQAKVTPPKPGEEPVFVSDAEGRKQGCLHCPPSLGALPDAVRCALQPGRSRGREGSSSRPSTCRGSKEMKRRSGQTSTSGPSVIRFPWRLPRVQLRFGSEPEAGLEALCCRPAPCGPVDSVKNTRVSLLPH